VLSQAADRDMATVFAMLRQHARDHNLRMSELAHGVVHRSVPAQTALVVRSLGCFTAEAAPVASVLVPEPGPVEQLLL
jgi:hypothetical protein